MRLKVCCSCERLVAVVTSVDLPIGVQLGVFFKAAGVLEELVAVLTLKSLGNVVDTLVLLKVLQIGEGPGASVTDNDCLPRLIFCCDSF